MTENVNVKTWDQAKEITVEKWEAILKKIRSVQDDIEYRCGFCRLAKRKAARSKKFRCNVCFPRAKELCGVYVTNDLSLLADPLTEAILRTGELLEHIKEMKPGE